MSLEALFVFLRNIDEYLIYYVDIYGTAIYFLLFLIVFSKTAIILLLFLPGDTVVFTSGAIAAMSNLDLWVLTLLFITAAFLGDQMNYLVGKTVGLTRKRSKLLKRVITDSMINKSEEYLSRYGRTAILFSRFIPVLRGTLPFTCATTNYSYRSFMFYNFLGCTIWTSAWLFGGYILGNIPMVQNNLVVSLFILSIIFVSPAIINFLVKAKKHRNYLSKI